MQQIALAIATSLLGIVIAAPAGASVPDVNRSVTPPAAFSWQVTGANRAPVLAPIPDQNPTAGGSVSFVAVASDADPDDTLEYWLAAGIDEVPAGAVIDAESGWFSWTPTEEQHGRVYRFSIGVSDSGSPRLSATQLVTVVVPKLNESPEPTNPGPQRSTEGDIVALPLAANDPDPGDTLRFGAAGLPDGLTINPLDGTISGVIGYDAASSSPFDVVVTVTDDGVPQRAAATSFQWTVDDRNRPPIVADAHIVALIGEPVTVAIDAEDPDGDALTMSIAESPAAGGVDGEGPSFTYVPSGGADSDRFVVSVSDGEYQRELEVWVEIRVTNSAPRAEADSFDMSTGEELRVAAPGVLANDSDGDNDTLVVSLLAEPGHGALTLAADGSFVYVPDAGFHGGDKFIYVVTDVVGDTASAMVVVNLAVPAMPVDPEVEGDLRSEILAAATPHWTPAQTDAGGLIANTSQALGVALGAGLATLPDLGLPLLFLAVVLLLVLVVGRVSVVPFGAGKHEQEGWVQFYDSIHEVGRVVTDGSEAEVFVHRSAIEGAEVLESGQRVRFIASPLKGRSVALRLWPV